jgi:glycosyltransferase involved in cell wall biosynthesis
MKTLGVVIATYNGERFIEAQLESLVAQLRPPDELIISDDGSTDRTLDIVAEFAKAAPFPVRIHVNRQRLGWAANFMAATKLCSQELIAFCDQDDVWHPRKIATLLPDFEEEDTLLVCHDAEVVNANLERLYPLGRLPPQRAKFIPLQLGPWDNAFGFTQIIRRDLLQFSNFWPQSLDHDRMPTPMAHDQWFFFLASVLGIVSYFPTSLALYRQHGNNAVGNEIHKYNALSIRTIRGNMVSTLDKAKASKAREQILLLMLQQTEGLWHTRIGDAVQKYSTLSRRLHLRSKLYSSPRLSERIQTIFLLIRMRSYSNVDRWCFGLRSLLKDLALALPFGYRFYKAPRA